MPIIVEPSLPVERYPRVAFVDAPSSDAVVRFDFNKAGTWANEDVWPLRDGFSIGVPQFEGEPDGIGVGLGLRELSFNLIVQAHDVAAQFPIAALSRELQRAKNWLLFQKSPDLPPMWFRTLRSQPGDLDFEYVYNDRDDQWYGIGVSLAAEPFAYGERVTLGPYTINNDPGAATNPLYVVLPEVVGDAPTPLRLRAKAPPTVSQAGAVSLLASTPAAPSRAVVDTLGTDTTLGSGGAPRVSFATTETMAQRVTYSGPTVAHGRYQVFARLRLATVSGGTSTFVIELTDLHPNSPRVVTSTTVTNVSGGRYFDLGTLDMPIGGRVDDEFLDDTSAARFALWAARTSGIEELGIDHLILVPTDLGTSGGRADLALIAHGTSADTPDAAMIDADTETARMVDASDGVLPMTSDSMITGGFPQATPGATNAITYLPTYRPVEGEIDSVQTTTEVTVSYAPRYLYLAGN